MDHSYDMIEERFTLFDDEVIVGSIVLVDGIHFSPKGLLDHLNDHFTHLIESSDKFIFTQNDVGQYMFRGHLPYYLGKFKLHRIYMPKLGLDTIEIRDPLTNQATELNESNVYKNRALLMKEA